MFDFLKKKLKESVEKLSRKAEEKPEEAPKEISREEPEPQIRKGEGAPEKKAGRPPAKKEEKKPRVLPKPAKPQRAEEKPAALEEKIPEPEPEPEKRRGGFLGRFRERVVTRTLSDEDIEEFFQGVETGMLEANVALEVVDFLKQRLKENLSQKQAKRFGARDFVREAFEDSLYDVVNQGKADLEEIIRKAKSEGRPACILFLGFNGSGKTTSIAKLAHYLKERGHVPVLAAADTFRAASIEQLEVHGERLGVRVIKHQYGADSAAVVFDAVKFAKAKGYDIVLADTAGRSHADKNLMDELSKVVRVNRPDLKVLVVDSLTGNDAVEQAKTFDKAAGVDAIVLTKIDVNKKGGAILSACYAIKKPILFLGTGQDYKSIEMFEPRKFAKELLE